MLSHEFNLEQSCPIPDCIKNFDEPEINTLAPLIIRNVPDIKFDTNYVLECFQKETEPIFSHQEISNDIYNSTNENSKDLYQQWLDGTTKFNVVDSANCHYELIPEKLVKALYKDCPEEMECAISYVLTNKNALTKFHIDPYDGWMYLYEGDKLWWFISPEDVDYLQEKGYDIQKYMGMNWDELVELCDGYLKGRIYVGRCNKGDWIYIPFGWAHRVYSFEKCVGISGTTNETKIHKSFKDHPDYKDYVDYF